VKLKRWSASEVVRGSRLVWCLQHWHAVTLSTVWFKCLWVLKVSFSFYVRPFVLKPIIVRIECCVLRLWRRCRQPVRRQHAYVLYLWVQCDLRAMEAWPSVRKFLKLCLLFLSFASIFNCSVDTCVKWVFSVMLIACVEISL